MRLSDYIQELCETHDQEGSTEITVDYQAFKVLVHAYDKKRRWMQKLGEEKEMARLEWKVAELEFELDSLRKKLEGRSEEWKSLKAYLMDRVQVAYALGDSSSEARARLIAFESCLKEMISLEERREEDA